VKSARDNCLIRRLEGAARETRPSRVNITRCESMRMGFLGENWPGTASAHRSPDKPKRTERNETKNDEVMSCNSECF
jgi:hypothetical protein